MYRIIGYNEPTDTAGFVILDQRVGRTVIEGKLTLKESDIDDLTLVVAKNNPLFDNVKTFHTHVEVYDDKELIFRGRAIKPKKSMESSGEFRREYIFEDIEAYLLDSVQRFYEGVGEKPIDFLKHLIEVHNSQVDKFQKFEVRNVTVTDSKDDAYRQIDYPKTRDAIKDKLLQSLGGYVVTTYKPGGPNYLDYLKDIGRDHKNDTPIQLSRNMKSASVQIDPTKVITRLVPLGKTLEPKTVTVDGDSGSTTGVTQAVKGDWTEAIKNAAYMMGITDLSQNDIDRIKSLIQHESNGNETIQNNWDSNAAAGHPSIGLLQYTQPTFDSYKVLGYENIRVGFHQLLALFNNSNWRSDIRLGGWGPTGSKRMDKPAHAGSKSGSWAWPFPNVGEGSFMQAQRFGNDGGYRTNSFHDGLDFGSVDHPGSEVHAIHGGTVTFKGYMGGLGNYVVTHSSDGFNIVYQEAFSSQSKIRVNVGDQIKTGDIIGWRDLDHLHVGVTKTDFYKAVQKSFINDGTWLDPQQLIKNGGDGSQASDKSQEVSNKDSARPKLTIADVNGGKDYLDIPDLQKEFGIIEGTVEFDNVDDPNTLLQQAKSWIQAQRIPESWSLTAIEVGLPNFNHFKVGDRYMFINPYVAKDQLLRVVQKEIDLLKPHASTLTIGDKQIGLTDYQLEVNRNQQAFERVRVLVNQMAAVQANTAVNQNPVVVDAGTGEDVSQLKFDMTQLQKVIKDQIPTGYVSVDEFNKLKAQVDALKGGS
ncbi:phage tail protein [Lactobacillus sp. 3B(2020)]|uniref:phage tail protein n=1 Tax=Lactobacillus sp. 3B(2020) TaxID=2695882 RepID=UPI0015DF13BD|nr:phage tail protein [Lactobacillus sp. 3B(2020)]QLL69795.1 peptidoglycan DD-metalloendopeptidase family protein [Lactobacillus sp. 3B(2020)]